MLTTADTAILLQSQIVEAIVKTIVWFDWICYISRKYFRTDSGLVVLVVVMILLILMHGLSICLVLR